FFMDVEGNFTPVGHKTYDTWKEAYDKALHTSVHGMEVNSKEIPWQHKMFGGAFFLDPDFWKKNPREAFSKFTELFGALNTKALIENGVIDKDSGKIKKDALPSFQTEAKRADAVTIADK